MDKLSNHCHCDSLRSLIIGVGIQIHYENILDEKVFEELWVFEHPKVAEKLDLVVICGSLVIVLSYKAT
jgi:hypothetical protein